MKPNKNWIKGAINPAHKGQFKAKAEAAGETTAQYAADVTAPGSQADSTTRAQGFLAKNLMHLNRKKHR
jgi:hypothetical protein